MLVAFIVNITGTALNKVSILVENRREIYTVYPALIDTVGDVGSVVGSTATTKLALGLLKPSFSAMRTHAVQIFGAWGASVIIFTLFSILSLLINGMLSFHMFLVFTSILLIANVIAVTLIVFISYAVSILTFVKGLDPDNFVIPIESSLADSITTIALLVALFLVG
jgi:mgtE-like transporter